MKPLGFSPKAAADLNDIADHIARDNPARAKTFVDELLAVCSNIPCAPDAFPSRPELGDSVRVALHGRYLILFRNLSDEVRIERVLHGARDLLQIFKE